MADTKLAHSPKATALIQICSYVDQIAQLQGGAPERVLVVTGGAEVVEHPFRTAEMMSYYRHAKAGFEAALVAGFDYMKSYPEPTQHCDVCRWKKTCSDRWHEDDRLPIVAGITRIQRDELQQMDVGTRGALGASTTLHRKFDRVRNQARLQVESDHKKPPIWELLKPETDSAGTWIPDRGLSTLPEPNSGDLFFDIEGDPFAFWEGLEYLFGLWEPGHGTTIWDQGTYTGLWALSREEERSQFEALIDRFTARLAEFPDMHVFHYGAYEPSHLKILAGRHATREDELDHLLRKRVFVDLYRVVRQGLMAGVESYSIKRLEDLYGYVRTIDLRDAGDSIVEFEFWLDKFQEEAIDDEPLRADIEAYNRDDCVSTHELRDWLEYKLRPIAAEQFGAELPRPPELSDEQKSARPRDPELVRVEGLLLTGLQREAENPIPPDNTNESLNDQHATWLLGQLLDWHNRERKSTWWRFFELMSLSAEELIREKESIGGLKYEGVIGTAKNKRVIHRYTFPAQEHDVSDRSKLHDPAKPPFQDSNIGPFEIDTKNLTLDIRRVPEWSGTHPLAVVPDNALPSDAQEEALLRIGKYVVENGIAAEGPGYRAARDLLRGQAPRAGQGAAQDLVDVEHGQTGKQAALSIAPLLQDTTLALQGPPGSGKTYTGARMILALVDEGKRVGITSNSHKVIGNLLTAICDAAWEDRRVVRVMQKGDKDEAATHDHVEIKRADDNKDVIAALEANEVDVVGGTPWLWAREDMEGKVHTLFVDEAGQVSLANVVALSTGATNVVLLGDPQQLDQPTQGVHPAGAGRSALAHLLNGAEVIPSKKGVFLEETWRMHPRITEFTSRLFYRDKLHSIDGLEAQRVLGEGRLSGSGLRWIPVEHDGNTDSSEEEAAEVARIWHALQGQSWVNRKGVSCPVGPLDIVIVSPFNAHRKLIQDLVPDARVGTVDKFQGQEAPVSIFTMATSRPEDAPRGMAFLYSLHRLNVATSRARALSIVVASPRLLDVVPKTPNELRMANGLVAFGEVANAESGGTSTY